MPITRIPPPQPQERGITKVITRIKTVASRVARARERIRFDDPRDAFDFALLFLLAVMSFVLALGEGGDYDWFIFSSVVFVTVYWKRAPKKKKPKKK